MIRALLLLFWLAGPVLAQDQSAFVTVHATGRVAVKPDQAEISVGVEVSAPTADRATRLNTARMNDVMAVLRESGIAERDIQTVRFSVFPKWNSQKTSSSSRVHIIGFNASNMVRVRVRDLGRIGLVLDALARADANRIEDVRFGVSEPGPHLDAARRQAVAEAARRARLYAEAAGIRLGALASIEEGGYDRGSPAGYADAPIALEGNVPISGGELEISASVTLRYHIAP